MKHLSTKRQYFDYIVLGVGSVGLAITRKLALEGNKVIALGAKDYAQWGAAFQSSAIAHSGIFCHPGTLKAQLCVQGNVMLRNYCASHDIPFRLCGKLIVATTDTASDKLKYFIKNAELNKINGVEMVGEQELSKIAPSLNCLNAIFVPSAGVFDSKMLLDCYQKDAITHGAVILKDYSIVDAIALPEGIDMTIQQTSSPLEKIHIQAKMVIDASGIAAGRLSNTLRGLDSHPTNAATTYSKGIYLRYSKNVVPFSTIVMPISSNDSELAIGAVTDTQGYFRFGPFFQTAENITERDCQLDEATQLRVHNAIRSYYPSLDVDSLVPEFAGLLLHSQNFPDFTFVAEEIQENVRILTLYGMGSPALTASLSIADHISCLISNHFSEKNDFRLDY